MANTKISQLPANTSPSGGEEFVYAANSSNGKITLSTMKTFVQPDLTPYATIAQMALKQDKLMSGLNIKTINGNSILGLGNLNTLSAYSEQDYSAMKGPCPSGFHIPMDSEVKALYTMWQGLGGGSNDGANFSLYLKLPYGGARDNLDGIYSQGTAGFYWTCNPSGTGTSYGFHFNATHIWVGVSGDYRAYGFSLRAFKDVPVKPDNTWTMLYGVGIEDGGIFRDSNNGYISISSDGDTWITIADKNVGATSVWNSGDALSQTNCGNYFQWGNNYGFNWNGTGTTSSSRVDTTGYGPGNYYSDSTFRAVHYADWSNPANDNLWGGETGVVTTEYDIYNYFQLTGTNITIGGLFIGGIAPADLSGSYTLITGDNSYVGHEHYLYIQPQTNSYSLTAGTGISNPFGVTLPSSTTKACLLKFYCDSTSTMIITDCLIAN